MWQRLPLRVRLSLPTLALIAVSLLLGVFALQIFSPEQFIYENEQGATSAKATAAALNAALAVADNPQNVLDEFGNSIGSNNALQFRKVDGPTSVPTIRVTTDTVPKWFIALLHIPDIAAAHPIMIKGTHVADIVFSPDLSADLFEKWAGFLAIALSGTSLLILAAVSAYLTTTLALRPLEELGAGLSRMRDGNYERTIPLLGPPEIRKSCEEANQLSSRLLQLVQSNRELLRKLVSLQDDERRALASELHDELGPLLFAIRANTISLLEPLGVQASKAPDTPASRLLLAAESMQSVTRRVIEGLSPLHLDDVGLEKSIRTLLNNARLAAPALNTNLELDARLEAFEGLLSQTIYRVVQEAITNVVRHAHAKKLAVTAVVGDNAAEIEVTDDGVGFPSDFSLGRGLTGMSDRIRALDGTFNFARLNGKTTVRCVIPLRTT